MLSAYAEAVLIARLLSKDHREDLITAIAKVGKLARSTAGRSGYYDPKEREAFSELQVKGLLNGNREPTEAAWESLDRAKLQRIARQLRVNLSGSDDAQAAADARILQLTRELTTFGPLRNLTELLGGSLRRLDLDANWATTTVALIAQELAVATKLKELNQYKATKKIPPSDAEAGVPKDFLDLTHDLEDALKKSGKPIPEIMLAIAKDYRSVRNKLCHQGGKVDSQELDHARMATDQLLRSLFPNQIKRK